MQRFSFYYHRHISIICWYHIAQCHSQQLALSLKHWRFYKITVWHSTWKYWQEWLGGHETVTAVLMTHIGYKVFYYFYVLFELAWKDCCWLLEMCIHIWWYCKTVWLCREYHSVVYCGFYFTCWNTEDGGLLEGGLIVCILTVYDSWRCIKLALLPTPKQHHVINKP